MSIDKSQILSAIKNYYGFNSDAEFARFLGIKPQTLSSWYSRNTFDVDLLYAKCEDIDANYLLSGSGLMQKNTTLAEPEVQYNKLNQFPKIPLIEFHAVAGFGNGQFSIEKEDIKDYYVVPKFRHKKIDFMIEIQGSSMYPKYNAGDVVACTIIDESKFIQWNKVHVIVTRDQGIIVKRIKPGSEHCLLMISDNRDYDPFEVPKDEILGIALVAGVIRIE